MDGKVSAPCVTPSCVFDAAEMLFFTFHVSMNY